MRSLRLPGEIPPEILTQWRHRAWTYGQPISDWRVGALANGESGGGGTRKRRRATTEETAASGGLPRWRWVCRCPCDRGVAVVGKQGSSPPAPKITRCRCCGVWLGCWRRRRRLCHASDRTASRLATAALMCPQPLMCPQLTCPLSLPLPRHWQCGFESTWPTTNLCYWEQHCWT